MHLIRFLVRSDKPLKPSYGRYAIGVETSIVIPTSYYSVFSQLFINVYPLAEVKYATAERPPVIHS